VLDPAREFVNVALQRRKRAPLLGDVTPWTGIAEARFALFVKDGTRLTGIGVGQGRW